jgi:hypothetical protein
MELRASIRSNALGLFYKREQDHAQAQPTIDHSQWWPYFYQRMLDGKKTTLAQLETVNQAFLTPGTRFVVRRIGERSLHVYVDNPEGKPMPLANYQNPNSYSWPSYNFPDERDDLPPNVVDYLAWLAAGDRLLKEKQAYAAALDKVIEQHTTLRQALQQWPALWELVPKEYQERYNAPVEREKAERVVEEVDTDALNAGIVIAKITS